MNPVLNEENKVNSVLNGERKVNSELNEENKVSVLNEENKVNSVLNGESKIEPVEYAAQNVTTIEYGFRSACSQVLATLTLYCLIISVGMCSGMPTVVIGVLNQNIASNQTILQTPNLILSDEQSSWLGSIIFLFRPVGAIVSGSLIQYVGRTRVMIAVGIPFCVGWITLYMAESVLMILLGTVIMALGGGCVEAPVLTYIGEISEPRLRGSLTSFVIAACQFGAALIFLIFALTDWRTTMLISAVVPALTMIVLAFIPESPTWLISKRRLADAEQSLRWVRGWSKKPKVRVEFERLVQRTQNNTQPEGQFSQLRRPEFKRPFIMIIILFIITIIPSLQPMRPFYVEIFQTYVLPIRTEWFLVLVTLLSIVASFVGTFTVHRFGKRGISLWSLGINTTATLLLSVCSMNLHWSGWIPLSLFCICFWVSNYGMVSLPWMYIAEVYPLEMRGIASGLSAASGSLVLFTSTKTYMNLTSWFGLHGTLFIYTSISFLGFIYVYFCVPETEGRSLEEIMQFFADRKRARDFNKSKPISSTQSK
uniref:Facilitated trehalose transporter Tret1 n=1 Tax=Cacopsylla melanoneura TaxID=428564 RepID=A0A8D8S3G4_9HEMI